jgi:integrase
VTVFFNKQRGRWSFDFWKDGRRHRGYCVDALGQDVTSKSAARQAEGVERRRVELEPRIAKPGELTVAMAIAALAPTWQAQDSWPGRQIWLRDIIDFFGLDSAIASIDQALVDDYVSRCRTAKVKAWSGGPNRDPQDPAHAKYWSTSSRTRSAATVNLYLGTLRQIFDRAAAHRDPMTGAPVFAWLPTVPEIRRPKRKARPMPDQVSAELMSIMPAHVVDAMMLTALFGFRSTEAFTLKRTQIDWDAGGVRLQAEDVKDGEDAFQPASQFALGWLRCLDIEAEQRGLQQLISWRPKKDGPFVPLKKPRAAWRRALAFMRAKYGRAWRWHDLRAAFITQVALHSGGVVAQQLARHSDFATTQGYIEVADEIRRLAADRIGGRAQILAAANESPQRDSPTLQFAAAQGRRKSLK